MEIERKWLVDKDQILPLLNTGVRFEQHYLNLVDDTWLIRARRFGDKCVLTLKSEGLLSREELEFDITEEEYVKAIKHSVRCINKTRFYLPIDENGDMCYEIDVFDDYDFIICEVEFTSVLNALSFNPDSWCIEEVTNDPNYTNVNLAK